MFLETNKIPYRKSVIVLFILSFLTISCSSPTSSENNSVIGVWAVPGVQSSQYISITNDVWTDVYYDECYDFDDMQIVSINSNEVVVTFDGQSDSVSYELQGGELILKFPSGEEGRLISSDVNINSLEPKC